MQRFSTTVLLSVLCTFLFGQNVVVKEEPDITRMMERNIAINKSRYFVDGWRVQILATPDRAALERTRQNFQGLYPNIPASWIHDTPWFKLRAGAFSSKQETLRLLAILKKDYPSAYAMKDSQIRPVELLNSF